MKDAAAIWFEAPIPYSAAMRLQDELVRRRIEETLPDMALFLEHTPVVTLGNRGRTEHLVASPVELQQRGIDMVHASRGGDVTYHGPGQMIIYPIIHLGTNEADTHGYLHNLEEIAIRTAADFGILAFRRSGKTGAWTDAGKLAAIGIRFKRWVTSHGMSFNVNPDLSGFSTIVPCGLVGEAVTSLERLLPDTCPAMAAVRASMTGHFCAVCRRAAAIHRPPWPDLPEDLRAILIEASSPPS
jgi:lipoate-protein ligase B